jgi:hypothetical protein
MNIQIAKAQLELIRIRQARKAVIQDDSQHWVTLNGAHVLIDGEGEVISGAGGKLNGQKLSPTSKSQDVSEHHNLSERIAQAGAKKHGGNVADYTKESSRLAREYKSTQELLGEHGKAKETFNADGMGKESIVKTAKGTEIKTRFKIVDADSLIASHDRHGNANPNFPQELQPRDRAKQTSQAWVQKTSKNLDVDSLGKTRRADSGAPIIGDDGVVESGNGRTMAIMEAYNNGHAEEYRGWLESEAADFGIDPETIRGMSNPVLVRVRTSDIDRATFTKEANDDDKLAMTATEKARSDASKLDSGLISRMSDDGDLASASNRDFIKGFISTLSDSEAAQYYTTNGQLTKQIYDRVQSAVFSKAYNNDRLLELMADDSKPEIKNIISALNSAAGQFIQAKALSENEHQRISNTLTDGIHISLDKQAINTLLDATQAIMESKNKGLSLEDYLSQTDVFGDGISAETAAMALFIKDNNRSPARLAVAFNEMASFVNKELERDGTEDLFGDNEKVNLIDVLKAANHAVEKQYGKKESANNHKGGFIDLFTETRGQKSDREKWLNNPELHNDAQDGKHWITVHGGESAETGEHTGQAVLISGDGTVIGGAGGKLNGKKLDNVKSKSGNVEKQTEETEYQKKAKKAEGLSATAKTAKEHREAIEAHLSAYHSANNEEERDHHMQQYRKHTLAYGIALSDEKKAAAQIKRKETLEAKKKALSTPEGQQKSLSEKKFETHTPEEADSHFKEKYGLGFENGSETSKELKKLLNAYRKNPSNENYEKYQQKRLDSGHSIFSNIPKAASSIDITKAGKAGKDQRKMLAHIDNALEYLDNAGYDVKSALSKGNVKISSSTMGGNSNGMAWQSRGIGYFSISHSNRGAENHRQIELSKLRKAGGMPRWSLSSDPDNEPGDAVRSTIIHELTHAIGMQPHIDSPGKLGNILTSLYPDYADRKEFIINNISEYATSNIKETDAELAALVTSPRYQPGTLPKELEDHVNWLFSKRG